MRSLIVVISLIFVLVDIPRAEDAHAYPSSSSEFLEQCVRKMESFVRRDHGIRNLPGETRAEAWTRRSSRGRRKPVRRGRYLAPVYAQCQTASCTGDTIYICDSYGWFSKITRTTVNASAICVENGYTSGEVDIWGGNGNNLCSKSSNFGGSCQTGSDSCGLTVDFHCATDATFHSGLIDYWVPQPKHAIDWSGTSTYILDGGDDMYDGGNRIRTSLCEFSGDISWNDHDNMTSVSSTCFGTDGGAYRVDKMESSMVLVAKNMHTSEIYFRVWGNLGADGYGSSNAIAFETELTDTDFPGGPYRGYVRTVCGNVLSNPSVNLLFITDYTLSPDMSLTWYANTNTDGGILNDIGSGAPIAYVLYAGDRGYCATEAQHQEVFWQTVYELVKLYPPMCAPLDITSQAALRIDPEAANACVDGSQMEHGTTCAMTCAPGYSDSGTIDSVYRCDLTTSKSRSAATASHDCQPNRCASYVPTTGEIPGGSQPCTLSTGAVAVNLDTVVSNFCTMTCAAGYISDDPSVEPYLRCPSDAVPDQAVSDEVTCTEIACTPVSLDFGVVGSSGSGSTTQACAPGDILRPFTAPTSCAVTCDVGFSGVDEAVLSCNATSNDGAAPYESAPVRCVEKSCAAFAYEASESPSAESDSCVEGVRLLTRSPNMTSCTYLRDGVILMRALCPASAANNSEVQRITATGQTFCAPFDTFSEGVEPDTSDSNGCYSGIILGVNTSQECSIRCGSGYFGMDGALRCPANAIDGVTLPEEHITCSPVTCQALQLNADVVGKSEGGAGLVQCINDLVLRAGDSCAIECAIGYIAAGDGVMNCPLGASAGDVPDRSLSCIENQCSTVNFGPGIVADTSSTDARACSDGDFLTTLTDTSCALKCDDTAGYVAASAVLTCPRNATFGQDPVGHIMCEENRCAAINMTFAESLGAATSNRMSPGCIDGLRLSTHSTNACFLMCRSGFAGPGGNASCAVDAREGDAPTLSVSCEELFCAPLELGRAIVGDASDGGRPCIRGLVLSAVPGSSSQDEIDNSSCRVRCADGYTAIGDDSGAATCTPSDVPTIAPYISYASFRCEENLCAPLTFPTGIVPLTTGPFDTTSCVPGTVLSTYETEACRVQCAPGFVGEGSRIGVVACDPRSSPGDAAVFNISCVPDPVLRIGLECQQIRPGGCEVVEAAADDRDFRHSLWNCEGIESQNNSTRVLPGTDGGDVVVISGFSVRPTHDASVFYFLDVNGQRYENVSVGGLISSEDVCIFDSDNSSLRCPLPSGTGSGSSNALRIISFERFEVYGDTYEVGELIDTGLLGACYVEYARPRIDRVIGCPTEGCSRTGGDFVTVQGANFGDAASLIFIDGQSCEEVHHVDSAGNASTCDRNSKHQRLSPECHSFVACRTPPIFANLDISSLMLVQDSQFSMPVPESGFAYALCSPGHVPSSDNVAQCRPCGAGEFNDEPGAAFCEPCAPGFSNREDGATECVSCGQNEFSIRGATACEVCPGGSSSSAGSDTCEECSIFYSVPFAKVGHCDVPYFLYISGVVVALLLCIVTYRVVKSYRSRALEVTELQSKLKARHDDIGLLSEAWMISWDEINLLKRLAHGASGEVYRGTLRNRYDVAVKIMSSGSASIEDEKEIAFLKRCRHPRLVLFLGCGYRPNDGAIFLVLEFCEEGTLEDYLYAGAGTASQRPSWVSRLQLLGDTAEGMLYLHLVLKTLHRDLKSPNVLLSMERGGGPEGLSKKLRAKVADFGTITKKVIIAPGPSKTKKKKSSSRHKRAKSSPQHRKLLSSSSHDSRSSIASKSDAVNERERLVLSSDNPSSSGNGSTKISDAMRAEMTLTAGVGSCLWMAPELHSSVRQNYASYTPAVDVFSFGIIMYEALECVQPWSLATELQFSYMIAEAVIAGRRPLLRSESSAPPGYVDLMKRCWSQQASDRPTFDVVFGELQYMMMTSYKASLPKRPKRPRRAPKLPLRSKLSDILQRRIVKASNEASSHGQDGTVSVRTEATGIEMSNV